MEPSIRRVLERLFFVAVGYLLASATSFTGAQALVYLGLGLLIVAARWWVVRARDRRDASRGITR